MLCETNRLVPDADGVLDDIFKLVLCVAGTELPRMGVHAKGHFCELGLYPFMY